MPTVRVLWHRGLQFVGVSENNHTVVIDTRREVGGFEAAPSPTELLLMGVGGCTAMDVASILKKKRVAFDDLEVEVRGEIEPGPPKFVKKIHLVYRVWGQDVPREAVERAVELSQEKYCTVSNTVKGRADVTWEIEVLPPKGRFE